MKIDGQYIRRAFLQPERQQEVGREGYDAGAAILTEFFEKELAQYDTDELDPLGQQIIALFRRGASVKDYENLIPMHF